MEKVEVIVNNPYNIEKINDNNYKIIGKGSVCNIILGKSRIRINIGNLFISRIIYEIDIESKSIKLDNAFIKVTDINKLMLLK